MSLNTINYCLLHILINVFSSFLSTCRFIGSSRELKMFSTLLVGIMLLMRSSVTCTSGSKSHKHPVSHKSSCIQHQLLRSYLPAFKHFGLTSGRRSNISRNNRNNFTETPVKFHVKEFNNFSNNYRNSTSVPEDDERKANASLEHQSSQHSNSFIISQPKPQTNINTPNQVVRQGKCRDIDLLKTSCCDHTIEAPAKYGTVRNNETRSSCQPLKNCLTCTKTKSKNEKRKNAHKRLNKREAFKIYRQAELADDDESSMIPDSLPTLKHLKHASRWQEAAQKYILYAPLDDNEDRIFTHKRRHSNDPVQLTNMEFDQLVALLGYNTFKDSDGKSVNVNQLCEQLTDSGVPYADTIKRKLRCQRHEEIKQGERYINIVRDSFANPCRHSPVVEGTLERSIANEVNSNDESAEPCVTFTEQTAPLERTIAKKSQAALNENTESQSLVFREFGSCNHVIETKLITLPGCVPKSVLVTRCRGNCQSSSVPAFDEGTQTIRQTEHCTCCSAHVIRFRTLRFHCPSRAEGVIVITMGFPFQCACRPCVSVPEVTAEQPYDY